VAAGIAQSRVRRKIAYRQAGSHPKVPPGSERELRPPIIRAPLGRELIGHPRLLVFVSAPPESGDTALRVHTLLLKEALVLRLPAGCDLKGDTGGRGPNKQRHGQGQQSLPCAIETNRAGP
jgi:hypothetical protein